MPARSGKLPVLMQLAKRENIAIFIVVICDKGRGGLPDHVCLKHMVDRFSILKVTDMLHIDRFGP